jgi:ethylbenzene dioxygenase ferredoxin subunit
MPETASPPVLCDTPVLRNIVVLCDAAAVTAAAPVRVERDGAAYAVFLVGARHYVTQDACTHGPGSLSEGYVDGDEIECPFHQGRFHIPTGQPIAPPCTVPLRVWPARVIDGHVCIDRE